MKKLITLALLCSMTCIGCKKSSNIPTKPIVGKWQHIKTILYGGNPIAVLETTNFDDPKIYAQFNGDGTAISSTKDGDTYTVANFRYAVSGTTLTLTVDNTLEIDTIKTITSNALIIRNGSYDQVSEDYFIKK